MERIVFVHLGPSPAEHLWMNVSSIKERFPGMAITVIYSDDIHKPKIQECQVDSYEYVTRSGDNQLLESLSNNLDFRGGFWRYSLERLIALESWHVENSPEKSFLHIESDILILNNFPFDNFGSIENLAWIKFNDSHDVSALLYSPNFEFTKWLACRIREEIAKNLGLTDMTVLSIIRNSSPDKVYLLPTISSPTSDLFEGLFDGASIGMWLHGRDPRNHYGLVSRHIPLPNSDDKAEIPKYRMSDGLLSINIGSVVVPLFNLHVHSKNRSLFGASYLTHLSTDVFLSKIKLPLYSFSPRAFLSVLRERQQRHGRKLFQVIIKNLVKKFVTSDHAD
jgi:hypothetical protein